MTWEGRESIGHKAFYQCRALRAIGCESNGRYRRGKWCMNGDDLGVEHDTDFEFKSE